MQKGIKWGRTAEAFAALCWGNKSRGVAYQDLEAWRRGPQIWEADPRNSEERMELEPRPLRRGHWSAGVDSLRAQMRGPEDWGLFGRCGYLVGVCKRAGPGRVKSPGTEPAVTGNKGCCQSEGLLPGNWQEQAVARVWSLLPPLGFQAPSGVPCLQSPCQRGNVVCTALTPTTHSSMEKGTEGS